MPFQITDTVRLVLAGIAFVIVVAIGLGMYSLFNDRARMKEIKRVDKSIVKSDKAADAAAKRRDAVTADFFKQNAAESQVLEKVLSHDEADFDDAARAEYLRVLNNALRGPQR